MLDFETRGSLALGFGSAGAASRPGSVAEGPGTLVVAEGIGIKGGIRNCDHLVVGGRVEAAITGCRKLEVTEKGGFEGSAAVEEASIAGRFEGELTVTGRLTVRSTARLSGTIRFGELVVEPGGSIAGSVEPIGSNSVGNANA